MPTTTPDYLALITQANSGQGMPITQATPGTFWSNLNSSLSALSNFGTSTANTYQSFVDSTSDLITPTVKTDNEVNIGTYTWIGIAAVIVLIFAFMKRK
jgi:hypothetical protein